MSSSITPINIFWFRRDLRVEDNHGLFQALNSNLPVLPIFIFDTNILNKLDDKCDRRVHFIHDTIARLNDQFLKNGSSIKVFNNTPQEAFEQVTKEYNIQTVYCNHDYEPEAIRRDEEVMNFLLSKNITFKTFKDQVLFEKDDILKNDGTPYTIFTPYSKPWKEKLHSLGVPVYPSEKKLETLFKTSTFKLPALEDLGFIKTNYKVPSYQINKDIIADYHNTRNLPGINGTSGLSVHLRFGTISVRKLIVSALALNEQWLNELIWREFFMMILYHFPKVTTSCFKSKYDHIQWRNNETEFQKWCIGETGFPIVDAGMRELNETGFMHNRVRMIVASFLTKDLLIDWRWGEAYFAQKLLDYDLSANNGNWQWAAGCGCDAAPYFRVFNPSEQTKKFDPDLLYIKKWIHDFDNYFITPIVDHSIARKRCLEVYKKAVGPS